MAKKTYVGVDNLARKITKMYIGVSDVTEFQYIESSGTQYIDTGVTPSENIKIEIKAEILDFSKNAAILGGKAASDANFRIIYDADSMSFKARYRTSTDIDIEVPSEGVHTFILDKNHFQIDETSVEISDDTIFSSSGTINLFRLNSNYLNHISKMRLFYCKIYENESLIRDFVPYKTLDDKVGLLDKTSNNFYESPKDNFTFGSISEGVGIARRIKKGYIGIGSVARPFLSDTVTRYGLTETPLTYSNPGLSATATSEYAFFAGGDVNTQNSTAFNKSLTLFSPQGLSKNSQYLTASTLDDKAYFGGGIKDNTSAYNIVERYDNSLVRTSLEGLTNARFRLKSGTIGDYVLFAGGLLRYFNELENPLNFMSSVVDCYHKSGTKLVLDMSVKRAGLVSLNVNNYLLFAGGSYEYYETPDCFDASLTRNLNASSMLHSPKFHSSAATVGEYGIILGGIRYLGGASDSDSFTSPEVFDASLTRISTDFNHFSYDLASTSISDFALFTGGRGVNNILNDVIAFDGSLTKKEIESLQYGREKHAAVTLGSYALFGGGTDKTVEVYTY